MREQAVHVCIEGGHLKARKMKILVFADIHGSVSDMECALKIAECERPDKIVICGDLFGSFTSSREIAELSARFNAVTYFVRGNNDRDSDIALLTFGMEDNAVMYHFKRTLFFTHGDVYSKYRIPPVLKEGDALIYGHTHRSLLQKYNGLYIGNVGSLSRPRDGQPCFMLINETGLLLKTLDCEIIDVLEW